ncbi:fructose-specific PTS transporter subunit EIIC [Streptomyces geranii]|uniref:fructose-specific PTS transporter subunit EIIC n=1 Tax=Streptomyces geranii TaxID=2058923 RepID=UPI00130032F6|nr:fructose-specific PTS transporter subunit EIIC [Streptomyces geranii]
MDQGSAPSGHIGLRLAGWLVRGMPYIGSLTGVGGLLIVLSYVIGGPEISTRAAGLLNDGSWAHADTWAALLLKAGVSAMALLPPVVAGYLAYGMAGRQAMVAGAIGGVVGMSFNGGFLAGLFAGLVAGALAVAMERISLPLKLRGITSMLVIPLLAGVATVAVVFTLLAPQVNDLLAWLDNQLPPLTWGSAALCGMVLGLMVCFDLSGAISKTAITFAVTGVTVAPNSLNFTIMAAVVAAAMVPPLSLSLATVVRRSLFTEDERTYGKVAWLFGAAFVPEGAIPFAVADPLRVLPAGMAGGAVTGALTMTFGSTMKATDGGLFSAGHLGKPLLFVAAVAAGVLVTTTILIVLKSMRGPIAPAEESKAATATPTRKKQLVAG